MCSELIDNQATVIDPIYIKGWHRLGTACEVSFVSLYQGPVSYINLR